MHSGRVFATAIYWPKTFALWLDIWRQGKVTAFCPDELDAGDGARKFEGESEVPGPYFGGENYSQALERRKSRRATSKMAARAVDLAGSRTRYPLYNGQI